MFSIIHGFLWLIKYIFPGHRKWFSEDGTYKWCLSDILVASFAKARERPPRTTHYFGIGCVRGIIASEAYWSFKRSGRTHSPCSSNGKVLYRAGAVGGHL